nr:fibronectin type III domain-containing protein [Ruminococcus sp.]
DYNVFYYKNKQTGRARMKIVRYKNNKYYESKTVIYAIKPVAVKSLKAVSSTNQIELTWDKLNGATSYQIEEFDNYSNSYNVIDTVKTNSYSDYLLDEGVEYKLRVRAGTKIDDRMVYGNCSDITVSTFYKEVKLKSAKTTAKSKAAVKWTAKTSDTKGYFVEYSENRSFKDKQKLKITGKTADSAVIKKLKSGVKYYFRVRSYNRKIGKYFYSLYSSTKSAVIK